MGHDISIIETVVVVVDNPSPQSVQIIEPRLVTCVAESGIVSVVALDDPEVIVVNAGIPGPDGAANDEQLEWSTLGW